MDLGPPQHLRRCSQRNQSNGGKLLEGAPESPTQMLQGSIIGLWSLQIISYYLIILTHLALARNTIPVFYNIYKCLQILRRFYVKREQIPNFRPVVSKTLATKTNLIDSWHIQIKFVITTNRSTYFSQLKNFIHVRGVDIINQLVNFNNKIS